MLAAFWPIVVLTFSELLYMESWVAPNVSRVRL